MLYHQNASKKLPDELFANPTCEYRDTPFWAWNTRLSDEKLLEQINIMQQMGMGGFHMHVRTGMDTPYLTKEYMRFIRLCVEKARGSRMLAWLYDEDRWPSGSAGGKVTAGNPENARKTLLFTPFPYTPDRPHRAKRPEPGRGQRSVRQDNGELLAVYDICLNEDGSLASSRRIAEDEPAAGTKWYAYMEFSTADPWFNNQPYVDTLNPDAIRRFIEITHEKYLAEFQEEFGKTIPAIFTDEPQFSPKGTLAFAKEKRDVILPWTRRLPDLYKGNFGQDLLDVLPELIWELPEGKVSTARYHYHDLLADLFVNAYARQIGTWCSEHGIALTGHLMGEPSLLDQTRMVGDAMRAYPEFGIPGIDMLCDRHEYTTAKQTQSMVRQTGKPGMLSELYGVTGWDADLRVYKLQGDWQAVLGVTVRVPHLAWMSMKGEAKRDYPASIFYQSPWWKEYRQIADHFARLNTALTRGKAVSRVAVIHPIESYWLSWGPSEQTAAMRNQLEDSFQRTCETLLFGKIDFDYINEARLPELCPKASFPLQVGDMAYDAVVVTGCRTLRRTTLERLAAFRNAGGRLIFAGPAPEYVDACPSELPAVVAADSIVIGQDPAALLAALEPVREVDVRKADGSRDDQTLYQMRQDGDCRWLYLANGKNPECPDDDPDGILHLTIRGAYDVVLYDTMTGTTTPVAVENDGNTTRLSVQWHIHDSLLLKLIPASCGAVQAAEDNSKTTAEAAPVIGLPSFAEGSTAMEPWDNLFGTVPVTLSEPNMLLLDMAEYSFDGGDYLPQEEILRIDNSVRRILDIPVRRKEVCQPYMIQEEPASHTLKLRFRIPSRVAVSGAKLALEDEQNAQITLNGQAVPSTTDGWFVDRDIHTVPLPQIVRGTNVLEVEMPFGARTNLEAFYLLGDFGVQVNGTEKTLTGKIRRLGWSDITSQGLPFYTGNIDYHATVRTKGGLYLRVPHWRGGLVKIFVDGKDAGDIAFSPYMLQIPDLADGMHKVTFRLYGTRYNGFAQLHHTLGMYFYQSPNSWRSSGDLWTYEYQLKKAGILKSPQISSGWFVQNDGSMRSGSRSEGISDRS